MSQKEGERELFEEEAEVSAHSSQITKVIDEYNSFGGEICFTKK